MVNIMDLNSNTSSFKNLIFSPLCSISSWLEIEDLNERVLFSVQFKLEYDFTWSLNNIRELDENCFLVSWFYGI